MRWVDVKDSLPSADGAVLVWLDSFGKGLTNCAVTFFSAATGRFDADNDFATVTHWMPLPAAPTRVPRKAAASGLPRGKGTRPRAPKPLDHAGIEKRSRYRAKGRRVLEDWRAARKSAKGGGAK